MGSWVCPATHRTRFVRTPSVLRIIATGQALRCFAIKPNFTTPALQSQAAAFSTGCASRSSLAFSLSRRLILACSGFNHASAWKSLLRVSRQLAHPFAQRVLMNLKVSGGLRHRHASALNQLYSPKLEFPARLPSLLHTNHRFRLHTFTRCLRNRQQPKTPVARQSWSWPRQPVNVTPPRRG